MIEELELPFEVDAKEVPEQALGTITVPMSVLQIVQMAPSGVDILQECVDLAVFLAQKNLAYGDSALNPVRAFSKATTEEQIFVRLDDKISRLIRGTDYPGDNDIDDILGYLVLYKVWKKRNDRISETRQD